MASQEFTVLYTHQKTKKAKAWQDGILRTHDNSGKAVLFDDKGSRIDSVFLNGQRVTVGLELESDRFLITVEELTNPANPLVGVTPKATNPELPRRPCLPTLKRKHSTGGFRIPREVEGKAEEASGPGPRSDLPGNGNTKAPSLQQGHSAIYRPGYTRATESGAENTALPALWGSVPGRESMAGNPNNFNGRREGGIAKGIRPEDPGGGNEGVRVLYPIGRDVRAVSNEDRRDREADPGRKTSECMFGVDSNGHSTGARRTKAQILALLMQGDSGGDGGSSNLPSSKLKLKQECWDHRFDHNTSQIGQPNLKSSQDKEQPMLSNKQRCLGKLQPHRDEQPSSNGPQPYMGMDSCKQHSQDMLLPYQQQQHFDENKHIDWSYTQPSQGNIHLNPTTEPCLEKQKLCQDKQTFENKVQPFKIKVAPHESPQPFQHRQPGYEVQSCWESEPHAIVQPSVERQPLFSDKLQPYPDTQQAEKKTHLDKQLQYAELQLYQSKQCLPEEQHRTSETEPPIDTQPSQDKLQPNADTQPQQDVLQPFPVSMALQNSLDPHERTQQQQQIPQDLQPSQDSDSVPRTVPVDGGVRRTEATIGHSQTMVDSEVFSSLANELWAGDSQPGIPSQDTCTQPPQSPPDLLCAAQWPATHRPDSVAERVASDESSIMANEVDTCAMLTNVSGFLGTAMEPRNIEDATKSTRCLLSKEHRACGKGGSNGSEDDGVGGEEVDCVCNVEESHSESVIDDGCSIDTAPVSLAEASQGEGEPVAPPQATETNGSQSQSSVDTMDISLSLDEQEEHVEEATEVIPGACTQRERLPWWSSPSLSVAEPGAVGHSHHVGQEATCSRGSVTIWSDRECCLDADRWSRESTHGIECPGSGLRAQSLSEPHGAGKSGCCEEREKCQEVVLEETFVQFDSRLVEYSQGERYAPLERDTPGWKIVGQSSASVTDKLEGSQIECLRFTGRKGAIQHSVYVGGSDDHETFRDVRCLHRPVVKGKTAHQPCLQGDTIQESYCGRACVQRELLGERGIAEKAFRAGGCFSSIKEDVIFQEKSKDVSLSQMTFIEQSMRDQTFEQENMLPVVPHHTQAQCNASHASFNNGCSHQHPLFINGSNRHADFVHSHQRGTFLEGNSEHPLSTEDSGQHEVFARRSAEAMTCVDVNRGGGNGEGGRGGGGRGEEGRGGGVEGGNRAIGRRRQHDGSRSQDRDCWQEAAQGDASQPPTSTNAAVLCLERFQQQSVLAGQDAFRGALTPTHVFEPDRQCTRPQCLSPVELSDAAHYFMAQRQQQEQDVGTSGPWEFKMSQIVAMSRDSGPPASLQPPFPPCEAQSSQGVPHKQIFIQIEDSGRWESPETGAWQPMPHAIDRRLEGQELMGGSDWRQCLEEGTTRRTSGQEELARKSGSSRWNKYHDSSLEHLIGTGESCLQSKPAIIDGLAMGDGGDGDDDVDGGDGDELEFNVSAEPTSYFNEYSAESGVLDWPSTRNASPQQPCFPNDAVAMEALQSCILIGPSLAERRALIGGRRLGSSLARSRAPVAVCAGRPAGSGLLARRPGPSGQAMMRLSELRFPSIESVLRQTTPKRKIIIPVSFSSPAAYRDILSSAIIEHLNLILHDTASRFHRKKMGAPGSRGRRVSLYSNCRLFHKRVAGGFGGRTLQRFRKKTFVTEDEMNSGIKRKLILLLSRKENHNHYSKDDLWVISTDAGFPPASVMVVSSVFYGPSASGELEVSPLREHTSNIWGQNATVHAIHVCNASWELSCLQNIRENVELSTLPVLPLLLSLEGSQERSMKARRAGFRPPLAVDPLTHSSWVDPDQVWPRELAEQTIAERGLNKEQGDVLRRVAHMIQAGADTAGVTIVQGVFGAGKSFMLSCIVMFLVGVLRRVKHETRAKRTPLRILVSAATNVAVDRVLLGLLDLGFEEFVRVGSIRKIAKPILPFSLHASSSNDSDQLRELQSLLKEELSPAERVFVKRSIETHQLGRNRTLLKEVSVVGATCASCPFPSMGGLCFPFAILDECSQITEPMSLLPIARFGCERLLLVGDPRQLPPTVQGSEPDHEAGLEQTLFTRLKHMGHPLVQLRTQYRCHPHISLLAASLFYQGELRDGIGAADRPSAAPWLPTLAFLDIPGQEKVDACGSYYNKVEGDAAVKLVDALVESRVDPEDIAVITLYRAQAARVHERLASLSGSLAAVRVCTADAFQGGEVRVCVLSVVRSPRDSSSSSSSLFVESERRACVALTRARGNLVVLGCAASLGRGTLWGRVLKHCHEHGAVLSSREFSVQLDDIIAARGCGDREEPKGRAEEPQKKRRKQNPNKSPQASMKQPQPEDLDLLGSDWDSSDEKQAPETQGCPQHRRILDLGSDSSDEE